MLEQAGLIECSVDEQRRKYFNIANNMRLEVSVSPYAYTVALYDIAFDRENKGEASGYWKKRNSCQRRVICFLSETEQQASGTENQAGRAFTDQQQLQAEYTELMGRCLDSIEHVARNPGECELLFELLKNETTLAALCYNLRLHPSIINANLINLAERGFIEYSIKNNQHYWKICETGVENK